jgi:hypothetical protein
MNSASVKPMDVKTAISIAIAINGEIAYPVPDLLRGARMSI